MKNSIEEIREIFSRSDEISEHKTKINYNVLSKGIDKNKNFDFLYSLFESTYHFGGDYSFIEEKWKNNKGMSNSDFTYTAIAFIDLVDKIGDIIRIFDGNFIHDINLENIFRESVIWEPNQENDNKIILSKDWNKIFKSIGTSNQENNSKNPSLTLIRIIRNKLVHPNSGKYETIHTSGNFSSYIDPFGKYDESKKFQFKSSFTNKESFMVSKDIFLKCMVRLVCWCKSNLEKWNKLIYKYVSSKNKHPMWLSKENIKKQLESYQYDERFRHNILQNNPFQADLYKVAKFLNNNDMQEFLVENIYLENFFQAFSNDLFDNYKYGQFSLYKEKRKFIKEHHNAKLDNSSDVYAIEKIGYWNDEESKKWFPNIFKIIDELVPGDIPFDFKIYAHVSKKINWGEMFKKQKEFIKFIEKMEKQDFIKYDPSFYS